MSAVARMAKVQTDETALASDANVATAVSREEASVRRLESLVREASRGTQVVTPPESELRAVTSLFRRTLVPKDDFSALRAAWSDWHMTLTNVESREQSFWLLRENSDAQTGRGIYAFRAPTATGLGYCRRRTRDTTSTPARSWSACLSNTRYAAPRGIRCRES